MKQFISIAILALTLGLAPPGYTASTPGEHQVKAAYLYNFIKFIRWPEKTFANAQSPLVIGVLGLNNFDKELEFLQAKKVRNRDIVIKYFKTVDNVHDCHLLYISQSADTKIKEILEDLSIQPIVTVGENEHFVDLGGVIQFITKRDRLRFLINQKVAQSNNIQIEAQLLSLAVRVVGSGK